MTETKRLADELEVRGNLLSTECEGDQGALAEFGEYVLDNLPLILTTLREAEGMREALECIAGLDDMPAKVWEDRFPVWNARLLQLEDREDRYGDLSSEVARLALSQGGGV